MGIASRTRRVLPSIAGRAVEQVNAHFAVHDDALSPNAAYISRRWNRRAKSPEPDPIRIARIADDRVLQVVDVLGGEQRQILRRVLYDELAVAFFGNSHRRERTGDLEEPVDRERGIRNRDSGVFGQVLQEGAAPLRFPNMPVSVVDHRLRVTPRFLATASRMMATFAPSSSFADRSADSSASRCPKCFSTFPVRLQISRSPRPSAFASGPTAGRKASSNHGASAPGAADERATRQARRHCYFEAVDPRHLHREPPHARSPDAHPLRRQRSGCLQEPLPHNNKPPAAVRAPTSPRGRRPSGDRSRRARGRRGGCLRPAPRLQVTVAKRHEGDARTGARIASRRGADIFGRGARLRGGRRQSKHGRDAAKPHHVRDGRLLSHDRDALERCDVRLELLVGF